MTTIQMRFGPERAWNSAMIFRNINMLPAPPEGSGRRLNSAESNPGTGRAPRRHR
jgi:hypothetical protein